MSRDALRDPAGLGPRLLIDVVAIALLALGLFHRRRRRNDIVVLYVIFNVGLFAAVVVISEGQVAAAVGFGLFAVLSIIRLQAGQLSFAEIAYFLAAMDRLHAWLLERVRRIDANVLTIGIGAR